MGLPIPDHDQVRTYLDSAVAEAAERWVGRATDATAYADLVAAVLARRAALSPGVQLPPTPSAGSAQPALPPVSPSSSPLDAEAAAAAATSRADGPRHFERRSRPRWPSIGKASSAPVVDATPAVSTSMLTPSGLSGPLPVRDPGRHRIPQLDEPLGPDIDLTDDSLTTVLDWLGQADPRDERAAD